MKVSFLGGWKGPNGWTSGLVARDAVVWYRPKMKIQASRQVRSGRVPAHLARTDLCKSQGTREKQNSKGVFFFKKETSVAYSGSWS